MAEVRTNLRFRSGILGIEDGVTKNEELVLQLCLGDSQERRSAGGERFVVNAELLPEAHSRG